MNRDSLSGIARETVKICEAGQYQTATTKPVVVVEDVKRALKGTVLYSASNLPPFQSHTSAVDTKIEVVNTFR